MLSLKSQDCFLASNIRRLKEKFWLLSGFLFLLSGMSRSGEEEMHFLPAPMA